MDKIIITTYLKSKRKTSKEKNRSLYEKLYSPGRSKSTFREGKMGYYKSHFTKRVEKELYKIISKKNLTMLFIGNTLLINNLNFIRFFLFIYI